MSNATAQAANNKRASFRQSLEMPIEMRVSGMPVTIRGTLMDVSAEGGRIRSLIALEKNAMVRFDFKRASKKTLELRGRIASRKKLVGQAHYEYGIAFDRVNHVANDALVVEIMEFQRRAAAERTEGNDQPKPIPGQKRGAFRAMVGFKLKYRRDGIPGTTDAEANDISAGGLRLICNEPLPKDVGITLEFTLPSHVLSAVSAKVVTDPSPFGKRGEIRAKPKDPRRPFEPMVLKGKIAARLKDSSGRIVLGVQFLDANAFTREEIQRYIHAAQLYKIRQSVDSL